MSEIEIDNYEIASTSSLQSKGFMQAACNIRYVKLSWNMQDRPFPQLRQTQRSRHSVRNEHSWRSDYDPTDQAHNKTTKQCH